MLMVAENISLGVLSLPAALSVLGIIPGLVLIAFLGILASYTGYVIGQFKIRYPHVHSMADAGEILFGAIGREVLGFGQLFFIVFIMAAHILSFSIMMNAITSHGTCTIVFMMAGTLVSLIFTLPRTLGNLSYYCIASFASVIAAVLITMIGVSITKPGLDPASNKQKIDLFPPASVRFHEGFLAMTNIVFAYAGHVAFFSFISELREPKEFPKALALLQCSDISMYIIASVVIYYYAGTNVASPALDSASPIIRKVAYGVAMPTIVIAGVVNGHVSVKYLYVRLFRNSENDIMHQKTFKAYGLWVLICAVLWTVAWVIAEGIPVFNDLLGIAGALFGSWFTFGVSGILWLQMNMKKSGWKIAPTGGWTWRKAVLYFVNWGNILVGLTIVRFPLHPLPMMKSADDESRQCVVGLYASGKSIALNAVENKPFSCADNSAAKS
jgi:amino acid permease